MGRYIKQII